MKKFIFTMLAMAIFSAQADLEKSISDREKKWHAYVGIGEGVSFLNSRTTTSMDISRTVRDEYSSLFSELFVGVEKKLEKDYFMGGKIFFSRNWENSSNSSWHATTLNGDPANQKNDLQQKWTLGVSAEFGTYITEGTKIYGALDMVYSSFSFSQLFQTATGGIGVGEASHRLLGIGPKIGVRTTLTSSLDVYLEGSYLFYETWNLKSGYGAVWTTHISPRAFNAGVGILYKF